MVQCVIFTILALLTSTTYAADADDVLTLWGSQGGPWIGHIDIYGPDSSAPNTVSLTTSWDSVPDKSIVTKIETFSSPDADHSAVTLMYVDKESGDIVTPYFSNGRQRDYRFAVVSASMEDETRWTTVIATPSGQEQYENRPARLRYVRTRTGNVIENTKEVKFLDQDSPGAWELRSYIKQTLTP